MNGRLAEQTIELALGNTVALARTLAQAAAGAARAGKLVSFGIAPLRAETGYGYLELAAGADAAAQAPQPLARFIEKPDAERAGHRRLLDHLNKVDAGRYQALISKLGLRR